MANSPVSSAHQIRNALETQNMTQADLAKRSGLSAQYISDILRERRRISAEAADRFERVLGLDAIGLLVAQAETDLYWARRTMSDGN